jgi:hypothetical protein
MMTDQLGNPVARYDYLPFGQEIPYDVGDREDVMCGSVSCYDQTDGGWGGWVPHTNLFVWGVKVSGLHQWV